MSFAMTCDPEGDYVLLTCKVTADRSGEERKEARGYRIWLDSNQIILTEESTYYQHGEYDEDLSELKRITLTRDELRHIYLEMERMVEEQSRQKRVIRVAGDAENWA